ncbi:hypothetical protein FN846DRAFT_494236 [Sphaerosporella brunnea]|uniref:Uncharacterized protein n=1 Tax=Sphaerosporella brunnea TaxID=1250544 RepID=A0A5J5F3S3_9PEZI|nr:hypothetical protein FN846DRAFT_494236 [Sphaerosporella brunnea]
MVNKHTQDRRPLLLQLLSVLDSSTLRAAPLTVTQAQTTLIESSHPLHNHLPNLLQPSRSISITTTTMTTILQIFPSPPASPPLLPPVVPPVLLFPPTAPPSPAVDLDLELEVLRRWPSWPSRREQEAVAEEEEPGWVTASEGSTGGEVDGVAAAAAEKDRPTPSPPPPPPPPPASASTEITPEPEKTHPPPPLQQQQQQQQYTDMANPPGTPTWWHYFYSSCHSPRQSSSPQPLPPQLLPPPGRNRKRRRRRLEGKGWDVLRSLGAGVLWLVTCGGALDCRR